MSKELEKEFKGLRPEARVPDGKPIEPEKRKWSRTSLLKWLFFLFAIVYVLLSYYHTPLLVHLGRYLIVQHKPQKSELIVCLAGGNVDRGLAVADAYRKGLAPKIFMAREEPPDGYSLLRERGVNYPDSVDLFRMLLEEMEVPRSAFFTSDRFTKSTFEEAKVIREFVDRGDYRSLIVITSPTHSRRAWLSLRKVFKKKDVRILMLPSPYSEFRPEDWWKKRRFLREVIIEYEKLIYYTFRYLW